MPTKKVCSKCGVNRILSQYTSPRGRVCKPCQKTRTTGYNREKHLDETYALTQDEYDAMLAAQDGGCAICGYKAKYNLQVDHCHKNGKVRGLLCKTCNKRLLPAARDNVDRLAAAIDYLNDPPAERVIGERVAPIHFEDPAPRRRRKR